MAWITGQTVQISLQFQPPPSGVELSAQILAVAEGGSGTFTVALTDDPGSDIAVSLVNTQFFGQYGDPGAVWDKNAVTVAPDALTFTAGSSGNWATPQTVTVSAPQDADSDDEQLAILILVQTTAGSGDTNPEYEPVGGAGASVDGIYVTVADNADTGPPTNLQALAGYREAGDANDDEDQDRAWVLRFSWNAPAGAHTVEGYDFQWRREGGNWPLDVRGVGVADTSVLLATSIAVEEASAGKRFEWRVRARTDAGMSGWETGTATLADAANLAANLQVNPGSAGELHMLWDAPASWPVTGYDVEYREVGASSFRSSDPEYGWVDAGHSGTDNFDLIENLEDGTEYDVRVRLTDHWGFAWTFASGTTVSAAPAIGGSEGSGGSAPDPEEVTRPEEDSSPQQETEALAELEAAPQSDPPPETPNSAPTVSGAIGDATIVNESGTQTVSLSGVFSDADNDALTVTAASSDEAVATVSVSADHSSLTVTAKSRGTATITVTADDGNGGTVEDAFTVKVKAAPVVIAPLADVNLEAFAAQEISLSGVFSDADGDTLTITASSSNNAVATVSVSADQSKLTVAGGGRRHGHHHGHGPGHRRQPGQRCFRRAGGEGHRAGRAGNAQPGARRRQRRNGIGLRHRQGQDRAGGGLGPGRPERPRGGSDAERVPVRGVQRRRRRHADHHRQFVQ